MGAGVTEAQLHASVAQYLTLALDPSVFWFHPVNEGKRGFKAQRDFKRLGGRAGLPDLCLVHNGRACWIELKCATGHLSPAQRECAMRLRAAGCPVPLVCRSLDEVIAALAEFGIPVRARAA
jgi:hypothetical protein